MGDQVDRVLAERSGWISWATSHTDRGAQRSQRRDEILYLEPRARRRGSDVGSDVGRVVVGCVRSLVGRALLPRNERGTWHGPFPSTRVALHPPALLHHAVELTVLCPRASRIRTGTRRHRKAIDDRASSRRDLRLPGSSRLDTHRPPRALPARTRQNRLPPEPQPASLQVPHENPNGTFATTRNRRRSAPHLPAQRLVTEPTKVPGNVQIQATPINKTNR